MTTVGPPSTETQPSPGTKAKDHWKKLRDNVNSGDVLLHCSEEDPLMGRYSFRPDGTTRSQVDIDQAREDAQEYIREATTFPLMTSLMAIALYILSSILYFSVLKVEPWSMQDSSYYAVVTFTTIGYGDLVPDTPAAKLFVCFWALSGVACLGIALGILGSNLIEVHESKREKALEERHSTVINDFLDDLELDFQKCQKNHPHEDLSGSGSLLATAYRTTEQVVQTVHSHRLLYRLFCKDCCSKICSHKGRRVILLVIYLCGMLHLIRMAEGWDWISTLYFGVITSTTIGYGDFAPQTETGRTYAIFFIPAAVAIMGYFLDFVASSMINRRREVAVEELQEKPLTLEDLRIMDKEGDGQVSLAEFMEFVLVAMNEVDQDVVDAVKDSFQRMDVTQTGYIDRTDLTLMARNRLKHNVGEKLRLHQYKKQLLHRAHSQKKPASAGVV